MKRHLYLFDYYLCCLCMILNFIIMLLSYSFSGNTIGVFASYLSIFSLLINCLTLLIDGFSLVGSRLLRIPLLFFFILVFVTCFQIATNITSFQIVSITQVLGPISCLFVCSNALRKGYLRVDRVQNFFIATIVGFIILFFLYRFSSAYSSYGGPLHASYYIAFLLPIILFHKNQRIAILILAAAFLSAVLSYKRGVLVALIVFAAFYGLKILMDRPSHKFVLIIVYLLAVVGFGYVSDRYVSSEVSYMESRMGRILEDDGSGRIYIYTEVIREISSFSVQDWAFGRGVKATEDIMNLEGDSAHNDWLELLYDYGVIATLVWFFFIIRILLLSINRTVKRDIIGMALLGLLLIYLITSMVSHVFFYGYSYIMFLFTALFIYQYENRIINIS